jgi:hypothetical protein
MSVRWIARIDRGERRIMRIIDRLRQWSAIRGVRPVDEPSDAAGGREGELLLKQLVGSTFRLKDSHLLAGRRIPSKRQGRRREIDLIVCTPRAIHLVEVKNWSGQLTVRDGAWRQTRRGGDVVDHGDLLRENRLKRDAVVEYLNDRGIALDERFVEQHIVPKVIFTNPRLEMDPATESRPDVISRRELDEALGRQRQRGLADRVFSSLVELCVAWEAKVGGKSSASGRIPHDLFETIVKALTEVGTWDRLEYHGTRVITGDVVGLKVGPRVYRRPDLLHDGAPAPLRLRWTRGRFWGLTKAVTGLGSLGSVSFGGTRLDVSPEDTVLFHAVGEAESSARRLVELDRIVLG